MCIRDRFRGVSLFRPTADGLDYTVSGVADVASVIGDTVTALPPGPAYQWDNGNSVEVQLAFGSLESLPDARILDGANGALINGEIIQFCNAVLIGPGRYRLSRLLRGRLGTEHRIASHPIGSRFVLLNEAVAKIDGKPAERLAARFYAYGPQALDIADPAWQQTTFAAKAVVRMPWSPVQIAGARNGGGDLTITWVRRTRLSGVWADGVDVPLNEESERYEVDVMNGATVVRTIAATTPTACYSAAQQVADFGAAQSSVSLRVYQLSASVGHGWPGAAII